MLNRVKPPSFHLAEPLKQLKTRGQHQGGTGGQGAEHVALWRWMVGMQIEILRNTGILVGKIWRNDEWKIGKMV